MGGGECHIHAPAYLANTLSAFSTCFAHNSNVLSLSALHVIFSFSSSAFFSALCLNNYFPSSRKCALSLSSSLLIFHGSKMHKLWHRCGGCEVGGGLIRGSTANIFIAHLIN